MTQKIANRLYRNINPWIDIPENHNYEGTAHEIERWGDYDLLLKIHSFLRPETMIEIGTWKGRSAIMLAKNAEKNAFPCEIVCIDTFTGSSEHWLDTDHTWFSDLKIKNGRPTLYEDFLYNVAAHHLQQYITPLPLPSNVAHLILRKH